MGGGVRPSHLTAGCSLRFPEDIMKNKVLGIRKMAERKYFINNGQANVGPFEMKLIIEKVARGELRAVDHICVNADNDEWVLICQHPEFLKHFEAQKPSLHTENQSAENHRVENHNAPPHSIASGPSDSVPSAKPHIVASAPIPESTPVPVGDLTLAQWYVLKGKNRFGPFVYVDLVRMLQEKSVFEYDYVWAQGLEGWKRIAEINVFSADHIKGLFGTDEDKENKLFHRRNFPRAKYETTIIVHDNNSVWKGKTVELSEGGAGVVIDNAMILPGQNIYLHFKPGPLSKPFNVLSEVVSKRYMKGIRDKDAPVVYGIKFININKQDREAIRMIHTAA